MLFIFIIWVIIYAEGFFMKHLIIINRSSGGENTKANLSEEILANFKGLDYEVYLTTGPREVIPYLRNYFKKETKETVRVYACGGDGTVHEVVNGLVGIPNAELAILAVGTGNDFVKIYGGENKFQNFKTLINGKTQLIDLSKIEGEKLIEPWYSINVINFGFDAIVGAVGNKYKEMGKDKPYDKAFKVAVLKGRYNKIKVFADDMPLNHRHMLLCTISQGQYVGARFKCAPKSSNTDGLMDVCLIKCMSFPHFGMIVNTYTEGRLLDKPHPYVSYAQAKQVKILAPKDIDICIDGEMIKGKTFTVSVVPKAIKLVIPE